MSCCGKKPCDCKLPPVQAGELLKDDPVSFQSLSFNTLAFPNIAAVINVAGLINPVSVGFSSPALGVLRYNGSTAALFEVSYDYLLRWSDTSGPLTSARFYTALLLNGTAVGRTYWVDRIGMDGDMENFNGQALLLLQPGALLSVGVGAEDFGTNETIEVHSISLIAR